MASITVPMWSEYTKSVPEWCDRCLLPSALRQHVWVGTGMTVLASHDYCLCRGCHRAWMVEIAEIQP